MGKISKIIIVFLMSAQLIACTCATPLKVAEIQKTDKKLSCKDVILEINESEHYRSLAKREEGIKFSNMFMPVCWVTSYVDAKQAITAADARVKYLGHIYDVLDCGGKSDKTDKQQPAANSTAPFVAPPIIQIQPVDKAKPEATAPQNAQPAAPQQAKIGQCTTKEEAQMHTHQHTDRLGKVYTHCHPNSGPHRHIED